MATIIQFPATNAPQVEARSGPDARIAAVLLRSRVSHGSLAWARCFVAREKALLRQKWEGKKRADIRRRRDFPKPIFVPDGAGFEALNVTAARQVIRDRLPDLGPEEIKLARAVKNYETAFQAYMVYGAKMEAEEGVTAAAEALAAMRDGWELAVKVMRANGEEPYR